MPTILAVDYGERRLGLALSDEYIRIPKPYKVIENTDRIHDELAQIIKEEGVHTLVLGRPRTIEGELGFQAEKVAEFAKSLANLGVKIDFEDETASTEEAIKRLRDLNLSEQEIKEKKDMYAAQIILEGYLNK